MVCSGSGIPSAGLANTLRSVTWVPLITASPPQSLGLSYKTVNSYMDYLGGRS